MYGVGVSLKQAQDMPVVGVGRQQGVFRSGKRVTSPQLRQFVGHMPVADTPVVQVTAIGLFHRRRARAAQCHHLYPLKHAHQRRSDASTQQRQ